MARFGSIATAVTVAASLSAFGAPAGARQAIGEGLAANEPVAGGLGIQQRFYAPFAAWLAQRGHLVLTFDPRGMGASRRPESRRPLQGLDADMLTWARRDFPAAVRAVSDEAGGESIARDTAWARTMRP